MCEKEIERKNVQFCDQLNKDHNRHLVLNKTIHRKQFSNEVFDRIQQANQRWNHFFNWNLSTLNFVAKYFDQLDLCQQCINHFISIPIDEQQSSTDSDDDDEDKEEWYSNQKPITFDLCEFCEQKIEVYLTQISPSTPVSSIPTTKNLIIETSNSNLWYDPNKYTLELEEEFRHSITTDENQFSSSNK